MLAALNNLSQLRGHYVDDNRDLLRILINATSTTEANLALEVLRQSMPEKDIVLACNLREVIKALPSSPFQMRTDEETLVKSAQLTKDVASMGKRLDDDIELSVTTAGNLVLDVVVRTESGSRYWNDVPVTDDFMTTDALDLAMESSHLLEAVISLVKDMGLVFNPKFYLSLEDWQMDYAEDVFKGIGDLF